MKTKLAYILSLLLVIGSIAPLAAVAQQGDEPVQDAMYVYRNDGKFHGFFNAEVIRVEFSKIDTLGREHIDYVVQEIETIDSLYRIPISAIDSVSFYTPRTEYVEDVKVTTASELWDYVVASDSMTCITLSASIPAQLVPAVGDKLCTTKSRKLLPGGFYGTVQKVSTTAEGIRLDCTNEGLVAYLKRHIFKGGVKVNEDERSQKRRQLMGRMNAPQSPSVVRTTLDPIVLEDGVEGEYELNDNFKLSGEYSVKAEITPTIYAAAFGAIGMADGMNMDCALHVNAKTLVDLMVKAKLEWSYDVPLSKRQIWITDTPFFVEIEPGMHYGMSGELELNHHEEVGIAASASAVINESLFTDRVMVNTSAKLLERKSQTNATGTFTGNFGPYFAVSLILGVEEIGKVGLRVEAGAKLVVTAEMNFDDPEAVDEVSTTVYDRLSGNGSMKIGPYGQVGYNWKFLQKYEDEDNIWEYEPGWEFEGGLVPKFRNINVYNSDPEKGEITVSANVEGNVVIFLGAPVGFAIYDDKGKQVDRKFDTRNYFDPRLWDYYALTFQGIEYDKWYTVHPVCHLMGYELVASPGMKFFAGERDLLVEPSDSLKFDYKGGTQFISVKNTFSETTDVGTSYIQDGWMTYEEAPGGYNVTVKPNETTKRREATMTFYAKDPDNWFNSRQRQVVIYQDIDPAYIGLLMQKYVGWTDYVGETPYVDVWAPTDDLDRYENGRADLWGAPVIINGIDVEDVFERNPVIKTNDDGSFTLDGNGITINGKFDPVSAGERYQSGSGTFTIKTDMVNHRKSKEDMENMLHHGIGFMDNLDFNEALNPTLDEHYQRNVEGTITVSWNENKQQYVFKFIGNGTLIYDAECYCQLLGLSDDVIGQGSDIFFTPQPNASLGETKTISINTDTEIEYNVYYELNE